MEGEGERLKNLLNERAGPGSMIAFWGEHGVAGTG